MPPSGGDATEVAGAVRPDTSTIAAKQATSGPIEAVVFDWDGTLVDTKRVLVGGFQGATEELLGTPFPVTDADIEEIVQLRGEEAFALIAKGDEALAAELAEVFHRHYMERSPEAQPFPGTRETIERLRAAGLRIGVATSKARIRLDLEAERTGLAALIDEEITGDEVAAAKPDPEAVVEVIRRLDADPAAALYVGDGPNDVLAGRAAGAVTVAVSFGFHPAEAAAAEPDHLIDAMPELLALASLA
jgi:HAD superfamily hydrolase (TIGR01509 family)